MAGRPVPERTFHFDIVEVKVAGGADPRTFSGSRACTVQASALEELMAQLSGQLPAPFDGEAARRRAGGGGVVQLELFDLDFGEWVEATSIDDRDLTTSSKGKSHSAASPAKVRLTLAAPSIAAPGSSIAAQLRASELEVALAGLAELDAKFEELAGDLHCPQAIALACTLAAPLAEFIGRADLAGHVVEFRNAALCMTSMLAVDRAVFGKCFCKTPDDFWGMFAAPCGGIAALVTKTPDDFTAEDAYTLACQMSVMAVMWGWGLCSLHAKGADATFEELCEMEAAHFDGWLRATYHSASDSVSDPMVQHVCAVILDLIRGGANDELPELVMTGAWYFCLEIGRARAACPVPPACTLLSAGIVELAVEQLQSFTPLETTCLTRPHWPRKTVGQRRRESGVPAAILATMKDVYEAAKIDRSEEARLLQLYIDAGLMQFVISSIRAYGMLGSSASERASVMGCWYGSWWLLSSLDFRTPEAAPVVQMLRGGVEAKAVQFVLENPLLQCVSMSLGTPTHATMVAAAIFGRDEVGDSGDAQFIFLQSSIDAVLEFSAEMLRPRIYLTPDEPAFGHVMIMG